VALSVATWLPGCGSSDEGSPSGSGGTGGTGGSAGSAGSAGSGGGSSVGPEPDPWSAPGSEDTATFPSGIQTGDATDASVLVSVHSSEPAVQLTVMRGTDTGWEEVASGLEHTLSDGAIQLELSDLLPDTTYSLAFYAADGQRRSRVARFRTAPAAGARRVVRFGATSCLGGNLPWGSLSRAGAERLDFFMLLGDTIYADHGPDTFQYRTKWNTALGVIGMQDLTASTSVIATWDDHEIDNNWSWQTPGIQAQFDEALAEYRRGLPQRMGPGGTRIWRKLSWGQTLDVFVLDCRGERLDGNYISPEQMSWLKQELSASTAVFKAIMNSVPIFDFTGTVVGSIEADDRWQGFPAQRSELLEHIAQAGVTGVFWVSGDFHLGGAGYISQPGSPGDSQLEVLTGPGGSGINPAASLVQPDARILSIVNTWNYVRFAADPDSGAIQTSFIDDAGAVLWEQALNVL
jgi:phosphodiesterase/alkaline phosphatase D-like protein